MPKRLVCEQVGEELRLQHYCEELADLVKSVECFLGVNNIICTY